MALFFQPPILIWDETGTVFTPFLCAFSFVHKRIMKPYAERFYKSPQWKRCRDAYMRSTGGLCEDCYKEGRIVPAEEVHHKIFITPQNINDPSITLNPGNLVALCRECHRKRHGASERRYVVDSNGRVTPK